MSIKAEIITIGDELLIGQVIDTNSAWLGKELNKIGVKVHQITSVTDDKQHILTALHEAQQRAQVVLITGGLGPTKDDITKTTLCEYFNTTLIQNDDVLSDVTAIFAKYNREVTPINKLQALVPSNCTVIRNTRGTAPAMLFNTANNGIMVSMPGVPYEMKTIMELSVLPLLQQHYTLTPVLHATLLTHGIGESMLAEMVGTWDDSLPQGMQLAYLPAPSMVKLRLSYYNNDTTIDRTQLLQTKTQELLAIVHEYVYGFDDDTIEQLIQTHFIKNKLTLTVAESCSGGAIAQAITALAGCSAYFNGGVVAYSNMLKQTILGVDEQLIQTHGVVSIEVVEAMAKGALRLGNSNYAIATSGIAGPDGGTAQKPVGTVCIAIACSDGRTYSKQLKLVHDRKINIQLTVQHALHTLYAMALGKLVIE
ncbi:MAG: competence/damage-inducible protein A [Bacteroidia bacterium]